MLELVGSGEKRGSVNPFGGGIDWLEVRLPELSTFRPQVQEVIEETVMKSAYPSSLHYAAVIDLRKTGIADAILHLRKKRGPEHSHKLQLTQAAQFSFGQHVAEIENIVDCNPVKLETMRTDLTVDLPNVPVQWVADHASIAGKQFAHYYDEDRPSVTRRMGKGEVQTFYCGKRPNCYRVYDKTAERWEAYKSFTRGWYPAEPDFDRWKKQVLNKTGQAYVDFEKACFLRGTHPSIELARMREAIDSCYGV